MESITGRPWSSGDASKWLLPYQGTPDFALAKRFEALGVLAPQTFGHTFWAHFKENAYAFPGEPQALNAAFSVPHDSVHVLTGYDTKPRGELLASTFTAAMHRKYPMAGHILPVIFSWHLKVRSIRWQKTLAVRSTRRNSGTHGQQARLPSRTRSRRHGISGPTSTSRLRSYERRSRFLQPALIRRHTDLAPQTSLAAVVVHLGAVYVGRGLGAWHDLGNLVGRAERGAL